MSEGYKIPVGVDLGDSVAGLDHLINTLEETKKAGADSQASIQSLNQELARQNKAFEESVKNHQAQKKALEEQIAKERQLRQELESKVKTMESDTVRTETNTKAQNANTVAMNAGRTAVNALRTAFASFMTLGVAAVLAGIAIYWEDIRRKILGVTKEMELQARVRKDAIKDYVEEKVHVENLYRESQRENTSRERKREIIKELNDISPTYFGNIKTEKDLHEQGVEAIERYVTALALKARAQAAQNIYIEELEAMMRFEQQNLKQSSDSWAQWTGSIMEAMGQQTVAQSIYLSNTENAFNKAKESTSLAFKVMTDAMNAVSDLNEKGVSSAKKTVNEYEKILESFIRQRKDAEVQAIEDETQRALAAEERRFERQKEAIQKQLKEFKGSNEQRKALLAAANQAIEQLRQAHLQRYADISQKALQKDIKAEENAAKAIAAMRKDSLDQQIADIEKSYDDRNAKIASGGLLTEAIEKELEENKNREIANLRQQFQLEAVKKDEEFGLATINAMRIQGKNQEEIEKTKEAMRLRVMIEAAKERIKVLQQLGGEENDLIILQTEALILELENKLKGLKPEGDLDIFSILGIKISDEEKRQILDGFDITLGSISTIFESNLQRQIDAKERQIDILSDQVSRVERELDRELALQEKGYANNVEAKKAELEAISAERNRAQAEQEEIYQKQAKLAAAQILLNGSVQTSELALAAAKIFKAHAGIPFAGVITAIAAVATMVATFAAMKAKISEMQSAIPKFRDGGEFLLKGPSHEHGGLGVYDERTGRRVAEVEGGEGFFATNKESTKKHRGLLEAINRDDFRNFHEFQSSLDDILKQSGVSLSRNEDTSKVVILAQDNKQQDTKYKQAMYAMAQRMGALDDIAQSNRQMLSIEKNKSEVVDMGDYILIKKGNTTRRIKKNGI